MRRYELSDEEWAVIEPLLPGPAKTGRPRRSPREIWNAIFWVLRSGAALGTTDTASIVIFNEFNRNTRYGYAASLALLLLGVIMILTLVNNRIAEERVFYG